MRSSKDTTPDNVAIPDGSLYVLQSPQSLWQKISGNWVQVGGANTNITATSIIACNPTTGTNAYVTTAIPDPITQYDTNVFYQIPISSQNTGASTIDIDGIGALNIKKILGSGLVNVVSGDITVSTIFVYYDGTDAVLQTGKEYVLYDNNGIPLIVGLDESVYFIQPPNLLTTTTDSYVLTRVGAGANIGEIEAVPLNEYSAVYVDPNGQDVNALKKNALTRYETITKANAYVSVAESVVNINSGLYGDTGETAPIFKNNYSYYLSAGALLAISGGETDLSGGINVYIYGHGEIRNPFLYSNANTIANISCYKIYGNGGLPIVISNCTINLDTDEISCIAGANTQGLIDMTNVTFNIKNKNDIKRLVSANTGNNCAIKISGGKGSIESNTIAGVTNLTGQTTGLIEISGACGDIAIKTNLVAMYATPSSTTPLETYNKMINVTNSSGTVTLDIGTIYGGVYLNPSGSGKVRLYLKNKLIADISGGDAVTIGAGAMATGIIQNKKTNSGSTALKVIANNGIVMNLLCQGGEFSVRGDSPYTLNVAGVLSTDTSKNSNITINPTAAYIYNTSYSLY